MASVGNTRISVADEGVQSVILLKAAPREIGSSERGAWRRDVDGVMRGKNE